jgi:hypothetical protein
MCRSEAKRSPDINNVNWDAVAYDLKDVDWSAVNWSSVFASTPAAAPTPTPVVEVKKVSSAAAPTSTPIVTPTPAAVVPTPSPKPATSAKAPAYSAAQPSAAAPSSGSSGSSGSLSDLVSAGAALVSKIGCKTGVNAVSNNGGIWLGKDSDWRMEVTNAGSSDGAYICWQSNGFTGMIVSQNAPAIAVGLKPGQTVSISFAPNVPSSCAPITSNSAMSMFGGVAETWGEVTFGNFGAFDVSRNVNMHGSNLSMKGSKCVSDMDTCVFKCKDSGASSCETGYDLYNCGAGSGGGGGYDPVMQGTGGGCAMGQSGEVIQVSFS